MYYCMIKSVEHVRYRLYPPDVVLPLIDNELHSRKFTTEESSENDIHGGEDGVVPA